MTPEQQRLSDNLFNMACAMTRAYAQGLTGRKQIKCLVIAEKRGEQRSSGGNPIAVNGADGLACGGQVLKGDDNDNKQIQSS
jgi:hypothetical protein